MKLPFLSSVEWMSRESSPVDWCEENYVVTKHIAEFVNTVSNVLFLVIPPLCCSLWSTYAHRVTRQIYVSLFLFFFIGICSAYFHATLSLLGQILDEVTILWVLVHVNYHFMPRKYWLKPLQPYPSLYKAIIAIFGALSTICAFVKPEFNQYALMTLGIPLVAIFTTDLWGCRDKHVQFIGLITLLSFFLAVASWICDKVICDFWRTINLTIFHGVWHIMIFVSTYTGETVACYNFAKYDVPNSDPGIRYWPGSTWGLPYVVCPSKKT